MTQGAVGKKKNQCFAGTTTQECNGENHGRFLEKTGAHLATRRENRQQVQFGVGKKEKKRGRNLKT